MIVGAVMCNCAAFAASASGAVGRGNRFYKKEKFEEALKEYEKAREVLPNSDIVNFNAGAGYYKNGDYQNASDLFTKSLLTDNPGIEAKASYNIGNSKYKQAEQIESVNLETAVALLKESLEYYQKAIELNDKDEDAKTNYEFVKKKIELLQEKLKQQPRQEQQQEGEEKVKDEGLRTGDEGKEKKGEKGENGQELEPFVFQEQSGAEKEDKKGAEEKTEQMSKEQALLLLEGYRQEEESAQREVEAKKMVPYPGVLKDW